MHAASRRFLRGSVVPILTLTATCTDNVGPPQERSATRRVPPAYLQSSNPPFILAGAGSIADCSASKTGDSQTATLLDGIPLPAEVFTLGDNAYPKGAATDYTNCYGPTWGRHTARTHPVPGDVDYKTSGATGYFNFFGAAAGTSGQGYYSFDRGAWHIIALNSEISKTASSPQMQWLRADLAAHPNLCTLAYWHEPLYSSTGGTGSTGTTYSSVRPFWDTLYAYGADLILNGHRATYERIAPIKPDGARDNAFGIRSIIAGTGGQSGGTQTNVFPASEVRNGITFGVLKLYLYDDNYAWRFFPVAGKTFTDSSSTACHGAPGAGGGGGVSASQSTVAGSPTTITASSGSSTSTITVTAKNANGNPVSGATVTLSATGSGNALTQPAAPTNVSGVATGTLSSTLAETKTVSATISGVAITQVTSVTVSPGTASALGFKTQPTDTVAGSTITPAVQAEMRDQFGNLVPSATDAVTVAIGTNPAGGMLSGTLTVNAGTGVATFSDLSINKAGTGYTLAASAGGLTGATSSTFNITAAPPIPATLAFVVQPSSTAAGVTITPVVQVEIQDQYGARFTGATNRITLAIATNPSGGTLSGTATVAAVNGAATFSDLSINKTGTGYTLGASTSGLSSATSTAFSITAATPSASQSTVAVSPATITASSGSSTSTITVTAKDANGNLVSRATVVLAATENGNTLTQPSGPTNANGVATGSLNSTGAGTKTVSATIAGVAVTQTATVTVDPGSAAALGFKTQPINTTAGSSITPAIQVEVRDQFGNPITSATDSVTLAIGTDPGGGTLSGTTTVAAQIGVATFSTLRIDKVGTGYTLAASTPGLTGATSNAFDVTADPPVATSLAFVQQPTTTQAGAAISPAVEVEIQDQNGARLTSATANLTLAIGTNPGSGTLGGTTTVAAVNGLGTFSDLIIDKSGIGYTLAASSTGLSGGTSSAFNINAAVPSPTLSTVAASPTSIDTGTGLSTITVTAKGANDQPVSGATVVLAATGSGNTLTQPATTTNTSGVATGTLSSTVAETKIVSASADGVAISQTATVTVLTRPPPPPQPTLAQVIVVPDSVALDPGGTQAYTAYGKRSNGDSVAVSVAWSATGGTICCSGTVYTAGQTPGNYSVIATDTSGKAGTAKVTINTPPPPPPPPVIERVDVIPVSATLDTGATQQFTASDAMSDGSTKAFAGTWSATGGTIASSGLYKAGSASGSYLAIALDGGKADTATITVTVPPPPPPPPPPPGTLAMGCPSSGYTRLVNVSTKTEIDAALANAQPGDQIRVAPGIYDGSTALYKSGTPSQPIVYCGVAGTNPTFQNGRFKLIASYVIITGLVFAGPSGSGNVWLAGGDHSQFIGNEVRNSDGHHGISASDNSNLRIAYNYIHDNGAGAEIDHGIYYHQQIGTGNVIDNNLITRSTGRGISMHDSYGGVIHDILVTHNTIWRCGSTGILLAANSGTGNVIANNIVADNGVTYTYKQVRIKSGSPGTSVFNNIVWSPDAAKSGIEAIVGTTISGNLAQDPKFVSPYTDLHLQAGSPAIGLGLPQYSVSPDYDGKLRDSQPDAGAFEQQ